MYLLLLFLGFVASFNLSDVAKAAMANDIVPTVIPFIQLTSRLFVNYSQPDGNYTNCDTVYHFGASMVDLNDTGITYDTPWHLRSYRPTPAGGVNDFYQYVPEIVWEPETNTTLYTLMMVDPLFIFDNTSAFGPYVQHYMVINIIGNNISTGDVINKYLGPGPADNNFHKYVFVLYAQPGMLNLTANQTTDIEKRANFNVTTFLFEHNLTVAHAINWVYAKGDTWGPVEQNALGFSKLDCFVPVETAARALGIVPSVLPFLNLTTHLAVSYDQPSGDFSNCGEVYNNSAVKFSLNDTGATMQTPWNARSYRPVTNTSSDYTAYQPDVRWNVTDNTTRYSLLMIDAGHSVNSTFTGPFIEHWMVVNILGNNISSGDLINPLLGPAPIDDFIHVYTFILYEQPSYLTLSPAERAAIQQRTMFNLSSFASIHNLTVVGVNWLESMRDAWSPVVQDALNITKLNCLGPVEDAARRNNIVPLIVPTLNLTTHLIINYIQPEGNYTNCGAAYYNNATSFSLNDTGVTTETPWNLRSYRPTGAGAPTDYFQYVPNITWTPQPATLYTLLMLDPLFILPNISQAWGPYVEHYMVLNIIGNDISTGNIINHLLGPAPADPNFHKYVFLLYPQSGAITLDQNETKEIQGRINFNLTSFLSKHNYTLGAAAINWVYAQGDTWGPVEQDALGFAKLNCFGQVEDAAKRNGIVPEVIPSLNLTTRLSVRFAQPADSYLSCGTEYKNDMSNFTLNDTSVTTATPWEMRSYRPTPSQSPDDFFEYHPEVHWVASSNETLYTLMMVDPVFLVNATHPWGPYVQHWMVINIPGNNISGGDVVNKFLGPAPNDINVYHKYTFVLYQQPGFLNLTAAERNATQHRINFNLPAFIALHDLNNGAAGINWGYAMVDPWALVQLDRLGYLDQDCFAAVQSAANYLGIVPWIIPALDLTTQLRVSFNQPEDSFMSCGTKITLPAFNQSLSDTDVSAVIHSPWELRSWRPGPNKTTAVTSYTPKITWTAATGLHSYALLVVDPVYILKPLDGPFVLHYMVLNINNTDILSGKVIAPYFGPAPLESLYHKYLFLLYHQNGVINLPNATIAKLQMRKNFSLNDFVATHGLGNPAGANWAFAQADQWSPVAQDYIGFQHLNCPPAPTPSSSDSWIHLTPGAFTAIVVIGALIILALLALLFFQRNKRRRDGYDTLPGEGVRKTSVNRK